MKKTAIYYAGVSLTESQEKDVAGLEKNSFAVIRSNGDLFNHLPTNVDLVVCQERHTDIIEACKNKTLHGRKEPVECEVIKAPSKKADK